MTPVTLEALLAARAQGRALLLATKLGDGAQFLVESPDQAPAPIRDAAAQALRAERSFAFEAEGEAWFLHVHAPASRLLVVGAVHIAQALVPLAQALGMAATVIDPRNPLATEARFPAATLIAEWPDRALDRLDLDRRTAVVMLTHDPKLDDPALACALRSEAFYIGVLGSRKSHAARLDRLGRAGIDAAALARIRGPVGLPIGAATAAEIALSILAEIVAVRRGSPLGQRPYPVG